MFIDSHCHLDRLDLTPYQHDFGQLIRETQQQGVDHILCVAIDLETFPAMQALVADYDCISLSLGVHPTTEGKPEPSIDELLALADHQRIIAIGETGLDYFHHKGDLDWQRQRFKNHIQVAKTLNKPLIIHTREAGQETLDILEQTGADQVGGIIHCFTEDWAFAQRAIDLNFYISFSGIVTFKNATTIKEVAKKVANDRFLIETDAPYLAPSPHRGKANYPAYVRYVAEHLAELRACSTEEIALYSTNNFYRLFTGLTK